MASTHRLPSGLGYGTTDKALAQYVATRLGRGYRCAKYETPCAVTGNGTHRWGIYKRGEAFQLINWTHWKVLAND